MNRVIPSLTEVTKSPKRPHFSTHLYLYLYTPRYGPATLG
nr:MAG TPA: hypothetical protein [Caudoviricetes sp.]